jgi:predicted Zn-dependent protease
MSVLRLLSWLLLISLFSGCATNPVTGDRELGLVSESMEVDLGGKQYEPSRQMQGGDFKLDSELADYVSRVGQSLVAVSDRKLPYEFRVINDSTPNAWALPGGKIAVNRGLLLELDSEAELAAVLAHEIVHAAARHGAKGMERGLLLQGAVVAAGAMAGDSDYAQLAVGAAAVGAGLINQRYSRGAESEADLYGMRYMARAGYDPTAAVALQETFVRLNRERKSNWLSGLFASHPPSQERVDANRQTLAALKIGGRLGREEYARKTAYLRRIKPAYDAYDEGRKALHGKRATEALSLAEKAIKIEPGEAVFYGLKADALMGQGRQSDAKSFYDEAIRRDPGYFRYYLGRGEAKQILGDHAGAQRDLERSVEMLPTATAHYQLGMLAQQQGDSKLALEHLKVAAGSRSSDGKKAATALLLLDLPQNPGRYLKTELVLKKGRLVIRLENPTPISVRGVEVLVGRVDASGRIYRPSRYRFRGTLVSRQGSLLGTDIRLGDSGMLKKWAVRVVAAEVVDH